MKIILGILGVSAAVFILVSAGVVLILTLDEVGVDLRGMLEKKMTRRDGDD